MAASLDDLPIELKQLVAHNLESDKDLRSFALIARCTYAAVAGDNLSFWRKRFLQKYDPPRFAKEKPSRALNDLYQRFYQHYRKMLRRGCNFEHGGTSRKEKSCLLVLMDLITGKSRCVSAEMSDADARTESFSDKAIDLNGTATSKSMAAIEEFAHRSNLLKTMLKPQRTRVPSDMTPAYVAVLVTLSHLSFAVENDMPAPEHFGYGLSQRYVYATNEIQPVFTTEHGAKVNMQWVLHLCNFWKQNLQRKVESGDPFHTLHHYLPEHRPKGWSEQLKNGTRPLGKRWINAYGKSRAG